MANPGRYFYKENVPKSSSYLHYWYTNANTDASLNTILHQSAQELIGPQLARFRQQQAQTIAQISEAASSEQRDTLLQLFDISSYHPEKLEQILDPKLKENQDNARIPETIENALAELTSIKSSKAQDHVRLSRFKDAVEEIISMFDPSGRYKGVITRIKNSLWSKYTQQALKTGSLSGEAMTSQEKTETARQLIRDILSRENEKVFEGLEARDKSINNLEVDKAVKKILLLSMALENFGDGESLGISEARVGHQNKDSEDVSGENKILNELMSKVRGMANYLKGSVGEMATVYGFLKAHTDALPAFRKGLKVQSKRFGSTYFNVDVSELETNESFLRVLENINKDVQNFSQQVSKADSGYSIKGNSIEANIGFSVKVGGKLGNTGTIGSGPATISLQGGTSLAVLLAREMHLSSQQYQAVVQLLAGHGSTRMNDAQLNERWEKLKQKLLQLAFVDVLTGSTIGGKAYFMVVGGSIISMDSIISNMISDSNLSLSMTNKKIVDEDNTGSLNRADYMALNTWQGSETPNTSTAYSRSDIAWSEIANLLYQTKINISMNIADIARFKSL